MSLSGVADHLEEDDVIAGSHADRDVIALCRPEMTLEIEAIGGARDAGAGAGDGEITLVH